MVLARQLLDRLPENSLLISDRYYGVPLVLIDFKTIHKKGRREFLVRAKENLNRRVLECYGDGSALVEIQSEGKTLWVREIMGSVRKGKSTWSQVRLWTSLLDWKKYAAADLLALYARRWEQESFYRELKVDLRSSPLIQSHTPLTASQEVAALIMAYAILVDERIKAARAGDVPVLRISFLKTTQAVRGLWHFLESDRRSFGCARSAFGRAADHETDRSNGDSQTAAAILPTGPAAACQQLAQVARKQLNQCRS